MMYDNMKNEVLSFGACHNNILALASLLFEYIGASSLSQNNI